MMYLGNAKDWNYCPCCGKRNPREHIINQDSVKLGFTWSTLVGHSGQLATPLRSFKLSCYDKGDSHYIVADSYPRDTSLGKLAGQGNITEL